MKALSWLGMVLAISLVSIQPVCGGAGEDVAAGRSNLSQETLDALDRSWNWLQAHPPDPDKSPLGEMGMDTWTWNLFSRFHPDPEIRARAAIEAKTRLRSLKPQIEPTMTSLSWWAILIRCLKSQGDDVTPFREELSRLDLPKVLKDGNPTTALWITELLGYSGFPTDSNLTGTYIVRNAAYPEAFSPTVPGAVALYHEVAPLTDLGRAPLHLLTPDQVVFASRILPILLKVCREKGEVDAAAETLVAAALLGKREEAFFREGIKWLAAQQKEDGTYPHAPGRMAGSGPQQYRHAILVSSWALLESLQ